MNVTFCDAFGNGPAMAFLYTTLVDESSPHFDILSEFTLQMHIKTKATTINNFIFRVNNSVQNRSKALLSTANQMANIKLFILYYFAKESNQVILSTKVVNCLNQTFIS